MSQASVPQSWPSLAAFNRRIAQILEQSVPIGEDGSLTPAVLSLDPSAKAAWIEYANAIERELGSSRELYDVRDVASKSADNAGRLAALFQVFQHGMGAVGVDAIERARRIAAWHLSESRRFFGELALPSETQDAMKLDAWILSECRARQTSVIPRREAQNGGPVRQRQRLDAALAELEQLDRTSVDPEGSRPRMIGVNPALITTA